MPFVRSPAIQLADDDGNAVEQAGVLVSVTITSGGGTLGGTTGVTTADIGMAVFQDLSITGRVGEKTLTFSAPGLVSARSSLRLTAGPPAIVLVHQGDNQSAVPGVAVATAPSVRVTDQDGNPVNGVSVIFQVTAGAGSITDPVPVTDNTGTATLGSWTLGPAAGSNTLTARAEGLTGPPITFTASGITEQPAGVGCFVDDQGRIYCADPMSSPLPAPSG